MRKIYVPSSATLLLLQMFFLLSCKSESKPDIIEESFPEAQAEIREAIRSIVSDAETANIEGLKVAHLVSDKFTKFGPRNFNRQDVISTNNSEEAFFGTITNYKQEILDLKIDVFGDIGIATYYPHVSFVQDGVEKSGSGRQTLVFLKTENGWKIVHEHGTPKQLNMNYAITPNDRASDEAAIRAIESAYDSAWNAGDITSILQLCTEDVVVIDPSGGTSVGRDGMERSLASLFSGVGKGSTHTSEIMGVHFVTDDVAQTLVHGCDGQRKTWLAHRSGPCVRVYAETQVLGPWAIRRSTSGPNKHIEQTTHPGGVLLPESSVRGALQLLRSTLDSLII
jgi:uncharacterized protein (TIGR02246 family)